MNEQPKTIPGKLTDADKERVTELERTGHNIHEQAKALGCSAWTLLRAKHRWGTINARRSEARKACHVDNPRPCDKFSMWFAREIARGREENRHDELRLIAAKAFINSRPKDFWKDRKADTPAQCEAILQWAVRHPGAAEWRRGIDKEPIFSATGRKRKLEKFDSAQNEWSM